jgi:VanZ family protein
MSVLSIRLRRSVSLWLPPILYAAMIFYLSSESDPMPSLTSAVWDKALHATEYAGFAFLLCRALQGAGIPRWTSICASILVACAYAGSDEWHQLFVPGRDADIRDWVADTVGGTLGAIAYTLPLISPRIRS